MRLCFPGFRNFSDYIFFRAPLNVLKIRNYSVSLFLFLRKVSKFLFLDFEILKIACIWICIVSLFSEKCGFYDVINRSDKSMIQVTFFKQRGKVWIYQLSYSMLGEGYPLIFKKYVLLPSLKQIILHFLFRHPPFPSCIPSIFCKKISFFYSQSLLKSRVVQSSAVVRNSEFCLLDFKQALNE